MEKKSYNWAIEFFGIADIIIGLLGCLIFLGLGLFFLWGASQGGLFEQALSRVGIIYILLGIGFITQIRLGILIIKLKLFAVKLNLYLIPLIAILIFVSYSFICVTNRRFILWDWFVISLIILYCSFHLYFFTRPKVKEQFK